MLVTAVTTSASENTARTFAPARMTNSSAGVATKNAVRERTSTGASPRTPVRPTT